LRRLRQKPPHGFEPAPTRHVVDAARQLRKPARLGNRDSHQADGIADQKPVQDGGAQACKPFLDACPRRHIVLKARNIGRDVAHHHGREERLLPRKPGIDGRLPGTGEFGDFVDSGASKPALSGGAAASAVPPPPSFRRAGPFNKGTKRYRFVFSASLLGWIAASAVCALAFVLMIPWEISRRNPMIDLRMVGSRQFGACFLVMLATGAILLSTTQFVPQLVQQDFGYTATWAGLVLSPGGLVTMVMMFVVGRLSNRIQPKYMIVAGAIIVALSMYDMTNVYGDLGFWFFARSRMLLGVGIPLIFLSITTASYDGVPRDKTDQASALINAARNTGGSIGVSLVSNVLAHREQFHQSRLVEAVTPSSVQYQDTLHQMTSYFAAAGSSLAQAQQQAIQWIGQQVEMQASFLAYMDVFWVLTLISLVAVPLALALRKVKLGGPTPVAH
jgi:hypothetical protein